MEQKKILIVDDEQDLCEILLYNLTMAGYHAEVAHSGEDAWNLTRIADEVYVTYWFSGGGFFGGAFGCTMDFTFPIGFGLTSSRL